MSDKNNEPELQRAGARDIAALLEEAATAKGRFDDFISSSMLTISQAVEVARTAGEAAKTSGDEAKVKIDASRDAAEAARGNAEQSAEKAKLDLEGVNALKVDVATIKGAVEESRKAVSADAAQVAQSKLQLEKIQADISAMSDKVGVDYKNVSTAIYELQSQRSALQDIVAALNGLKISAESDRSSVATQIEEVTRVRADFVNLNAQTAARYEELVQKRQAANAQIAAIGSANEEIQKLRNALFVTSEDKRGTKDEIEKLRADIEGVLAEVRSHRDTSVSGLAELKSKTEGDAKAYNAGLVRRFDALYQALQEKILALLPSAGAAGLASTYYDAKSRYAPTSSAGRLGEEVVGYKKYWKIFFGYNPASLAATIFFYALFLVPLGFIAYGSYTLLLKAEADPKFVLDARLIALRVLIALPLATISAFGFASLALYRRLFEEYNHKQRVMELYESFKNEIETEGDEGQKKKLLSIMLDSVADKAWRGIVSEKPVSPGIPVPTLDETVENLEKIKALLVNRCYLGLEGSF